MHPSSSYLAPTRAPPFLSYVWLWWHNPACVTHGECDLYLWSAPGARLPSSIRYAGAVLPRTFGSRMPLWNEQTLLSRVKLPEQQLMENCAPVQAYEPNCQVEISTWIQSTGSGKEHFPPQHSSKLRKRQGAPVRIPLMFLISQMAEQVLHQKRRFLPHKCSVRTCSPSI